MIQWPGIPPAESAAAAAFWLAFWAALYSRALYGAAIGLTVGIAVWLVQRQADRRDAVRDFERGLAQLKRDLIGVLDQPDVVHIDSAAASIPPGAEAAMQLIRAYPISTWQNRLPDQKSLFELLEKVDRGYTLFQVAARKLDHRLKQSVRARNYAANRSGSYDSQDCAYFMGRSNGASPLQVLPWLDLPGTELPKLEETYRALSEDPAMTACVTEYSQERARLASSIKYLQEHFRASHRRLAPPQYGPARPRGV